MLHFVKAKGVVRWFLTTFRYAAIVNPFTATAHILEKHFYTYTIRKHEGVHYAQIERDGKFLFSIRYLYYLLRYGYLNNPYEIEARKHERSF